MRHTLFLILLLAILNPFRMASAQGPVSFESLEVQIWPEYDKPSVLVIYYIQLAPGTPLPAHIEIRIPAAAQAPHVVAVGPTQESVTDLDVKYSLQADGDWVVVQVDASGPAVQLEYYDPSLIREGDGRKFTYQWPADHAVAELNIKLQQPFDARELRTAPPLANLTSVSNGLIYHEGSFGALLAGQPFDLTVQYRKDSDALSISFIAVEPSAPLNENTAGRISIGDYLPWLVGATAILLVAGGAYLYLRGDRRLKRVRDRHAKSQKTRGDEIEIHCHQCGTRARAADRFCRTCGTRLRVEAEE